MIDEKDFEKRLNKALHGIGIDIQEALKDMLTPGVDPTGITSRKGRGLFQSHLKTSIKYSIEDHTINISMLDYATYLEYGTPHAVDNFDQLKDWVKKKILKGKKASDKAVTRIANNVKKNIETKGMRPFPFMRTTFNNKLMEIIERNLADAFN